MKGFDASVRFVTDRLTLREMSEAGQMQFVKEHVVKVEPMRDRVLRINLSRDIDNIIIPLSEEMSGEGDARGHNLQERLNKVVPEVN